MQQFLLFQLAWVFLGSLIGALMLRPLAARLAAKQISFGSAYLTLVIAGVIHAIIAAIVFLTFTHAQRPPLQLMAALHITNFLIVSGVIGYRHQLPFRTGLRITLFMLLIVLAVAAVITIGVLLWMRVFIS